ncbi:MAG: MATE family efflux transporter [Spirochaetes bacterium]|nr:MATE family efflux transporter [Spirochaetota bacterium]
MRDFTTGSVLKHVIAFSMPLIASNVLVSGYSFISMIFVGRMIGSDAIAAVSSSMPIIMLFPSLLIGLASAAGIIVSQAYGAKDMPLVRSAIANSFISLLVLCVLLSLAGFLLRDILLAAVNAPVNIRPMASQYLAVVFIGMVFQFFFNWIAGMLRGLGDAVTPFYIIAVSTVLNIALVPIFIGVAHLGVSGAAWAMVVANFVSCIGGYFYIIRRNAIFDIRTWRLNPDMKLIGRIFFVGIPASLQMIITALSGIFILSLVNRFGSDVTAAFGLGMQIDQIAFFPAMTIGIAVTTMTGQNIGAGKLERVRSIMRVSMVLSLAISAVLALVVMMFPVALGSLFLKQSAASSAVLSHLSGYYRYIGFVYLFIAVMFTIQGVVRGSGDTIPLLILAFIALIALRIPLAAKLSESPAFGENGIWIGILISAAVAALISYIYYKIGRWKKVKLVPATAYQAPAE